jgi:hypothetical protein
MPLHPPGTLESGIDADKMIGLVDPTTVKEVEAQPEAGAREGDKVPLGQIIGLPDFAVRLSLQAALSLILLPPLIGSLIF